MVNELSVLDLSLASILVLALAGMSLYQHLSLERHLLIAASRTVIQLTLIGYILKFVFESVNPLWMIPIALFMLAVATREILARQSRRFSGIKGYFPAAITLFSSSFVITLFALTIIIRNDPWYLPQYAIPLLGMIIGNSMNGITLALDNFVRSVMTQRLAIEQRLILGFRACESIQEIRRESFRAGLIPSINMMAAAGVVSLPGMMTGQILGGTPPVEAVKYQIMIMFMVVSAVGFGTFTALWFYSRYLFDERQRLRLDKLIENRSKRIGKNNKGR